MKFGACKCSKKKKIIVLSSIVLFVLALGILIGALIGSRSESPYTVTHYAKIEIEDYGTLSLELYGNDAPLTVENFVRLAESGFYDGLAFHIIIDNFVIQGGYKPGASLPTVKGEFSENGVDNAIKHTRGTLTMMRPTDDYDGATSQFRIVHTNEFASELDGEYAAFGRVISGMKIVDSICKNVKVIDTKGENAYMPLPENQPRILSITVEAVGK